MAPALSETTRNALEKALQQSGGVRLVSKGAKFPGLFPSGTSRDVAAAIAQCKADGLLLVEEKTPGKSTTPTAFATITREGAHALFAVVDSGRRAELLKLSSPENRKVAEEAYVAICQTDLRKIHLDLSAVLAKEEELADQLKAILVPRITALSTTRIRLTQMIAEAESGLATVSSPPTTPPVAPPQPVKPPRPGPRDESDLDFQRDQSEQLVFAWKDATSPEAKELLAAVMYNSGLEQLGEKGALIPFDQTTQEIDELVDRGDMVEVVEPGWRLSNSRGVYLISKTQVRKKEAD